MSDRAWRLCSSCKTDIGFGQTYWACSVSTCNQKRTGLYFCSVSCWEAHLPLVRHREAYAVEKRAPTATQARAEATIRPSSTRPSAEPPIDMPRRQMPLAADKPPPRPAPAPTPIVKAAPTPIVKAAPPAIAPATRRRVVADDEELDLPDEILIVASKLKKYIKARSGMNTSDGVMNVLSDYVRRICDLAIRNAGAAERKTVLERDFPKV